MANPPDWVYNSKHNQNVLLDNLDPGNTNMASASVAAGVVTAATINQQPNNTGGTATSGMQQPAVWSTIWFAVALVYLICIYYGMIRVRKH